MPPLRRGRDWPGCARSTRARDLNQCRICGKASKSLHADHVIPLRLFEERDEGRHKHTVLLCRGHHALKTALDRRLYEGKALDWFSGLQKIGYPAEEIAWARSWLSIRM
jgi:5-methylcytosine-specific restriction endonuclease McrA